MSVNYVYNFFSFTQVIVDKLLITRQKWAKKPEKMVNLIVLVLTKVLVSFKIEAR